MMFPIHHAFAPHVDRCYLWASIGLLVQPWRYRHGQSAGKLERAIESRLGGEVFTFGSGRQALLAFLQATIKPGDEVIVQGYTCVVVSNAIHAAGAKAVYADIELETLNIHPESVEQLITSKTKVVLCQHTFGVPANLQLLKQVCDRHRLLLIEDCAHVFPDQRCDPAMAHTGDAVLLSFGRDKAISGVFGGAIVVRSPQHAVAIRQLKTQAVDVPLPAVFAYLCYPLIYAIGKPLMAVGVGRYFLWFMRKIRLLVPVVRQEEKEGHQPLILERMPNVCAQLAWQELKLLEAINDHRRALTAFYLQTVTQRGWQKLPAVQASMPLQKFPIFTHNAEAIRIALRSSCIHLEDGWQNCVICPTGSDIRAAGYQPGSDPMAEDACQRILSLPTHPTMSLQQARRLVDELEKLLPAGAE